jgi:hypothetical protein
MLPAASTVAVLFSPTTFVRLKMLVDSAMNSEFHAFADREETRVADVKLGRAGRAQCIAANEQRTLERTGGRWIAVQHAIAPHVEDVAALNRGNHCDAVAVYKISEDSAAALQYRCVKEVAIERMPPISQRIAAIASAVGRIGQEEIGAIDIVLFWCVINGVRPRVGREHFKSHATNVC